MVPVPLELITEQRIPYLCVHVISIPAIADSFGP